MAYDPNQPRNEDGERTIADNSARKSAGLPDNKKGDSIVWR